MTIRENCSLKAYNTFGIEVKTRYFAEFTEEDDLVLFLSSLPADRHPILILGGGSNILFTTDFQGTIIHPGSKGISLVDENPDFVLVKVSAGENWDDFVQFAVSSGWGGVENLSLIPGTVGAAPVQNIGAYGVEIQDAVTALEAVNLKTAERKIFSREECRFGYRTSIFKILLKGQYLILNVTFRLSKKPELKLDYSSIKEELSGTNLKNPAIRDVRELVCRIRRRILPDHGKVGNAGSFFKNPVISSDQFQKLIAQHPAVKYFPDSDGFKIAAAWMIEECGWKGQRSGDAGVHPDQPLVLVNYGNATGTGILDLSSLIRQSVYTRFGILLEPEVVIL